MWKMARALLAVGLLAALAAPAAAQEVKVGKIDVPRTLRAFEQFATHRREVEQRMAQLNAQLTERAERFTLLLDEEWNKLQELRAKGQNLSEAERAELDKLMKLSDERDRQLAELETKPERTEAERDQLNLLQSIKRQAQQGLKTMQERLGEELRQFDQEGSARIQEKFDAAVKQIAEAQGLTLVVSSELVFFGGTDITDAVIAALNAVAPAG